ncbi:MAG: site-specific integrase, partial [Lactobacillaceae bacterium]|nr:site-specific integrase [Lactobacillaceae bacterium]
MNLIDDNLIDEYARYLKVFRQYSQNTIDAYISDINEFVLYFETNGGLESFSNLNKGEVRMYLNNLYERRLSKKTIARKISSLRNFYKFYASKTDLETNPFETIEFKQGTKKLPDFLYQSEIEELFDFLEQSDDPWEKRDLTIFEFLYGSGLRVSELADLTLNQIDKSQNLLNITG